MKKTVAISLSQEQIDFYKKKRIKLSQLVQRAIEQLIMDSKVY